MYHILQSILITYQNTIHNSIMFRTCLKFQLKPSQYNISFTDLQRLSSERKKQRKRQQDNTATF